MKPVARALLARGVPTVIFTGQHRFFAEEFGLNRLLLVRLGCSGQANPHSYVRDGDKPTCCRCCEMRRDLIVVQRARCHEPTVILDRGDYR